MRWGPGGRCARTVQTATTGSLPLAFWGHNVDLGHRMQGLKKFQGLCIEMSFTATPLLFIMSPVSHSSKGLALQQTYLKFCLHDVADQEPGLDGLGLFSHWHS